MATRTLQRGRRPTTKVSTKNPSRTVHFKSVPVHGETYSRLSLYRIGSLSFNDVLIALMSKLSPEEFHKEYLDWQHRIIANMDKSGDFEKL